MCDLYRDCPHMFFGTLFHLKHDSFRCMLMTHCPFHHGEPTLWYLLSELSLRWQILHLFGVKSKLKTGIWKNSTEFQNSVSTIELRLDEWWEKIISISQLWFWKPTEQASTSAGINQWKTIEVIWTTLVY